jgi:hypothetical protein
MKKNITKIFYPVAMLTALACSDSFLNIPAKGVLSPTQLQSQAGVEQILIGTYSCLKGSQTSNGNIGTWATSPTGWVYGGVVGQEAFKGSNSGDQATINPLSQFTATSTNPYIGDMWISLYDGVNRANTTIKNDSTLPASAISPANRTRIKAEARFLRGWFHLYAKVMWNNIPYIDQKVDYTKNNYDVSNTIDAWPMIEADFKFAFDSLPGTAIAKGRANKWAAAAFLAKCYMFENKLSTALPVLTNIITNGTTAAGTPYGLNARFRDAFEAVNDNSKESVFAVQASVNDGSGAANANADGVLNWPYLSSLPVGCCGFYQPSFDQMNSYRTDANGMPLLDGSYNTPANVLSDESWGNVPTPASVTADAGSLDPRIDWTSGREGTPYFDWGNYSASWVRSLSDGGPYTPKKLSFPKTEIGVYTDGSSWTPGYDAVNYCLIRYPDVLLWAAECEVDAGNLNQAETYVNMVRARVQDPTTWVRKSTDPSKSDWQAYLDPSVSSNPAGNYHIGLYDHTASGNQAAFASSASAKIAVHFERKLELGMEGHIFFDYVRWGEALIGSNPNTLQSALNHNGGPSPNGSNPHLNSLSANVHFAAGNAYYPIPQDQIDLSKGALTQNNY